MIVFSPSINETTLTDDHLNKIKSVAPNAKIIIIRKEMEWEQVKASAQQADVAFGSMRKNWIKDLPNLRWIQLTSAGADRLILDTPELVEHDLILTNSSGVHAIPISEHIFALMLTLSRNIQASIRKQIKHQWLDRRYWVNVSELNNATMGLIGVGQIGQMTAKKAKMADMKVLGLRRNPKLSAPFVDKIFGPDGLMDLLKSSDWVVITAPLTAETRGMIGESEFRIMKKSAYIINVARGPIIQEKALIQALKAGWIAGAGLDVFETEPLPESSPLWDLENVVITNHAAGTSPHHIDRRLNIFLENLKRYQAGDALINVVDKHLGY